MEELKEGWRRVRLSEVVDFNPENLKNNNNLEFINYLDTANITEGRIDEIKKMYPKDEKIPSRAKRVVQINDVIYSSVRPNLKHYGILKKVEKNLIVSTGFIVLRAKHLKISPDYLYNFLRLEKNIEFVSGIAETSTTTYPSITSKVLEDLEIELPPLETQEKIASILSALDDKIEVNNEMNKTLEEMAQTLFKRWFIDFDFPNENGEPYRSSGGKMVDSELGEIPEGWRVSDIYKISNVIYGAPFKSKQFNEEKKGFPLIRIRDLKTFNPQFFTEENHPKKTLVYPGDLLVGMDAEFRATPWLGKIGVLNQRVCMFSPNKDVVGKYFLKMILEKPLSFFENSKVATTVIHLGKSDVDMIKIICPNDLILEKFKELTECIYKKKINNAQEIQSLTEIRDTLLPKLMSGEVEV